MYSQIEKSGNSDEKAMIRQMITVTFWLSIIALAANAQPAVSASKSTSVCTSSQPAPALPLRTNGRYIVDAQGVRFKLSGVAWYGAEGNDFVVGGLQLEPLEQIVEHIRCLGFNAVRLPWSNEMVESNPIVPNYAVTANPQLEGLHALAVYDRVVQALTRAGVLVILDNHNSNAEWCCSDDGNDLWYNSDYPETSWIADWKKMVKRYRDMPQVVAADLRNEPRVSATWGGDASTDWHAAAERGGNAVLSVNPSLLIMVEGVNYALDLTGVADLPVLLKVGNRLVYSAHDYPFDHNGLTDANQLASDLNSEWGYIITPGQSYTAPLWLGEFGNCHTASTCISDTTSADGSGGLWFASLRQYLSQNDISWSWWAINGTETTGNGRTFGSEETYGVLNPYWNAAALPNELNPTLNVAGALETIEQPNLGPGVQNAYPPLVAFTMPLPGTTTIAGTALTLTVDAQVRDGSSDSIQKVDFYADGRLIGTTATAPYSIGWQNVAAGNYQVQAIATTAAGLTTATDSLPVSVLDYTQPPLYADAISINFVSYAVTPMAPGETAGVWVKPNWNQAGIANSAALPDLVDQAGQTTSAQVSWSAPNTYFTPIPDQAGNNGMMKGYLDNSNTLPNSVTVSGLPVKFTKYDVIVYFDGDNGTATRVSNYRFTSLSNGIVQGCAGQGEEGSTITGTDAAGANFAGTFIQAAGGSAGNYVMFLNCSGASFSLQPVHGGSSDSQVRAPINGMQILAHQ